jgi:hypothetical protein
VFARHTQIGMSHRERGAVRGFYQKNRLRWGNPESQADAERERLKGSGARDEEDKGQGQGQGLVEGFQEMRREEGQAPRVDEQFRRSGRRLESVGQSGRLSPEGLAQQGFEDEGR